MALQLLENGQFLLSQNLTRQTLYIQIAGAPLNINANIPLLGYRTTNKPP